MPLPDGRVPDEAQIIPDTGLECRFTGSKASTDTKVHHTSRGAPVSTVVHKGRPQYPQLYTRGTPVPSPQGCTQGAPQYPRLYTRGTPVPTVVHKRHPSTHGCTQGVPPVPTIVHKGRPSTHSYTQGAPQYPRLYTRGAPVPTVVHKGRPSTHGCTQGAPPVSSIIHKKHPDLRLSPQIRTSSATPGGDRKRAFLKTFDRDPEQYTSYIKGNPNA